MTRTLKIGLISDVHADHAALTQAFSLLRRLRVERVLCAGDIVEKGPDGDRVVQTIMRGRIPTVSGNHDFSTIGNQAWLRENAIPDHPHLLEPTTLEMLKRLPQTYRAEYAGRRLFMAHGAPWSINRYIFPNSDAESLQRVVEEANADVVVLGHTHQPMQMRCNGTLIVNPGSVCGTFAIGTRTVATLTLPSLDFTVYSLDSGQPVKESVTTYGWGPSR